MTPTPVTIAELKKHLNLPAEVSPEDAELTLHLEAATEAIENRVGPIVTREITEDVGAYNGWARLSQQPVVSVSAVSTVYSGVATALSAFGVNPESGLVHVGQLSAGHAGRITYLAGRGEIDDVPTRFKLAVMITAAHLWETQRGRGVSSDRWGTQDDEDLPAYMRGFALPRRALELIGYDERVTFA